jgi:hypothetical protein
VSAGVHEGVSFDHLESERFSPRGPVVLATLASRPHPDAEDAAISAALEAGVQLLIVNAVTIPILPLTLHLVGIQGAIAPEEEDLEAVRASAARAASFGVAVEHVRVATREPVPALAALANERRAGLLIFGPDPKRIGTRRFRAAARQIRRRADCLVLVMPWE